MLDYYALVDIVTEVKQVGEDLLWGVISYNGLVHIFNTDFNWQSLNRQSNSKPLINVIESIESSPTMCLLHKFHDET